MTTVIPAIVIATLQNIYIETNDMEGGMIGQCF